MAFQAIVSPARAALIYITAGAVVVIWTIVWYVYLLNNPPETKSAFYWATGSGLTMILIGFGLGRIGRAAQGAGLAPQAVPLAVMNPQQNAAAPVLMAAPAARQV